TGKLILTPSLSHVDPLRTLQAAHCCIARLFAERKLWNIDRSDHSGLAPENLTTLAHFSVSPAMSLPKSAVDVENGVAPKSAILALIFGSASPALISLLSLSMISAGVFLGAPTPFQLVAS